MIGGDDREREQPGQQWDDGDDLPLETERLALEGEQDDRLPWLEAPDDDDYEEQDNSGMARLVLLGALALVVIVAAIWWVTRRGADETMAADGSTIAAPPGPYKEAPKDPGGKTFAGTGDSSFAVSEGQTKTPQLAASDSPPTPAPAPAPVASPVKTGAAASPAPVAVGGVGVQVGAFSSRDAAESGWNRLVSQSGGLLSGVSHRVIAGTADNGTIYRLQAVSGNPEAAKALCGKLKSAGIPCQVK
jgi:cell division septation protein DedD